MPEEKSSRPRRYAFGPAEGFANPVAANLVAALDEVSARHFDMIVDLPDDVLRWPPAPGWFSIVQITAHMMQAEAGWGGRVTEGAAPGDISEPLDSWRKGAGPAGGVDELEAMCRRIRDEITKHRIAPLADIDRDVRDGQRILSVRGVLMHEVWHWTYHSGQAGLIRGMCGHEYTWQLEERITGPA